MSLLRSRNNLPEDLTSTPSRIEPSGAWGLAGILALSAWVIFMRWTKMDSLYNHDPAMWLDQVRRFASGEIPYRDFAYVYPPFTIFLLGWIARFFGATFASMQAAIDVISLCIVLLCWWLVRYLLSPRIRFVATAAVIAICSTTLTMFNLFSFSTYSPALEIAAVGLLMLLIGGVRQLRFELSSTLDFALICGGLVICTTTKPEATLAAWAGLAVLFALDRSRRWGWYLGITVTAIIVAASAYILVGEMAGFRALAAGVQGYGLATFACPYWPTGYGLFGAVAAIGESAFIMALLIWPFRRRLKPELSRRIERLWVAGLGGLIVFLGYVWYQCRGITSDEPMRLKLEIIARNVIWTSPALLPVMWTSICLWLVLLLRRNLATESKLLSFVLTIPVATSARSLFGTTLVPHTEVTALCYPFFAIIAAYLIESLYAFTLTRGRSAAVCAVSLLLGGYGLLRVAGAYPELFSNNRYYALKTNAGTVHLSDDHISAQIYSFVVDNTNSTDLVLDLPYGSGFNFASGRGNPAFTTMFVDLRPPDVYQRQDLNNFRRTPPRLVIADSGPHFQTIYGYKGDMECPFPRFVWAPDQPSWDPLYVFPAIRYIEQNYRVLTKIGPKLILGRLDP